MVPTSVVRKMFGKGVIFEGIEQAREQCAQRICQSRPSLTCGEPIPVSKDIDLDPEKELSYELDFEIGMANHPSILGHQHYR